MINSGSVTSGVVALGAPRTAPSAVGPDHDSKPNTLAKLTPEDRELIAEATGTRLDAAGLNANGRALAPMIASTIALDRTQGILPAGQPVTITYLNNVLKEQGAAATAIDDNPRTRGYDRAASASYADSVGRMIEILKQRGAAERLDIRA